MKSSPLYAYEAWITWNIMAYSPRLARGLYLLLLMVPISCCFYYLFHYKFGFSRYTAFTAAVLPNILPYQWNIPAGIVSSYTLWGLLFSTFSLIIGFHYLEKNTAKNWTRWLGAALCYFIATQLMEQSIFLFPPIALAFLGYTKFNKKGSATPTHSRSDRCRSFGRYLKKDCFFCFLLQGINKKHIRLITSFFILAVAKFTWMILAPRYLPRNIPFREMLRRTGLYFKWSLPSPNIEPVFLILICTIIILIGFILYRRDDDSKWTSINKNFFHMKKKVYALYLYAFFICWSVSSIIVFITIGDFWSRYTHISAFGLNAIIIFSIYVILNRGLSRKYKLHIFIFSVILIFSGVSRYSHLKKKYTASNHTQSIIIRDLNKVKLPLNSQVVIVGVREPSPGWSGSSGYLKFALKRNDINGLVGKINASPYYNFDNHFNPWERKWGYRNSMTGLSIHRPTFLFLMLKKQQKLKQLEYALQWKGKTKNAPWTILKTDKTTGNISSFISGVGLEEYRLTLKRLEKRGISQSEILWGGPPTKKELERLENLELDAVSEK